MKLLFVGTDREKTGAARHFVALAHAMVLAGHQVEGVISAHGMIATTLPEVGVPVFRTSFRNALDVRGYATVLHRISQFSPDWLVGNFGKEYWPLIACGRLTHTPVALFRHRHPPLRRLSRYGVPRLAQRFMVVSEYARAECLRQGMPPDRVQVSYNPVNTTLFRPNEEYRQQVRREFSIDEHAHVIGYAGRLHDGKGVIDLMRIVNEAMADQACLHAIWVGDGPALPVLRQMANASDFASRHHFTGWVKNTARYYNAFSFLAFPSLQPETFGRVAIEAESCGVPVLGSDIGGIPETMLGNVTGYLIEPGNPTLWRNAILALCDEVRCKAMGSAARNYMQQRFSHAIVARDFEELLSPKFPMFL